jgi:hypothetical protein
MESRPHHILALSIISLLKQNQHPPHLLDQFDISELKLIIAHFKSQFIPDYKNIEFDQESFYRIKSIIKVRMEWHIIF